MVRRQEPDWDDIDYDPTSEIGNSWDRNEPPPAEPTPSDTPPVTVQVDDAGLVTSVELASDWKRKVDPRDLHTAVLNAVQTATVQVVAGKIDQMEAAMPGQAPTAPANIPDTTPLNKNDVRRLMDEVFADLDKFTEKLQAHPTGPVTAESQGKHVRGSARGGHIVELWVDANWASSSRNSEIEHELNHALRELGEKSSAGELAQGPRSRAIDELHELVADPQLFLRRIGLPPQ